MVRLVYVIVISIPFILYYLIRCDYVVKHASHYTEKERYSIAQHMVRIVKRHGRIKTDVFGVENLPKEGGYVMYPNHQGKYDALGLIYAHKEPCSFIIESKVSRVMIANEFTKLLDGGRLERDNPKSQVRLIHEIAEHVKNGRRYFIFPEGQYNDHENDPVAFKPGAFKCSVKSKAPIVPVALVDSYKVFGVNSLRTVRTQVHFLEPLYYEDYKDYSTAEIAEIVRTRIIQTIERA